MSKMGIFTASLVMAVTPVYGIAPTPVGIAGAVGAVDKLFSLFGNSSILSDLADVSRAGSDLAEEIGDDPDSNRPDGQSKLLQERIRRIEDGMLESGYTKQQTQSTLGHISDNQKSFSSKIRSLRRTVKAWKSARSAFKRLIGNPAADSLARQTSAQLQAQSLHETVRTNQILLHQELDQRENELRLSQSAKGVFESYWKDRKKPALKSSRNFLSHLTPERIRELFFAFVPVCLALGGVLLASGAYAQWGYWLLKTTVSVSLLTLLIEPIWRVIKTVGGMS